jgi:hypothetical protein
MSGDLHFGEYLSDDAVLPDYEGGAFDAHNAFTVQVLLFVDPVSRNRLLLRIRQQRHVEIEFVAELCLLDDSIRADPEDNRTLPGELSQSIPEPGRFLGSAGGIRLGKEEQDHDLLSGVILQAHQLLAVVRQGKVRSLTAFL